MLNEVFIEMPGHCFYIFAYTYIQTLVLPLKWQPSSQCN